MLVEAMMAWAYDQEGWEADDYRRYIGHTLFIAHKAQSGIYIDKAMVDYDKAIRLLAEDYGLEEFAKGNHDCVMDHFKVENTRQAQEARRNAAARSSSGGGDRLRRLFMVAARFLWGRGRLVFRAGYLFPVNARTPPVPCSHTTEVCRIPLQ